MTEEEIFPADAVPKEKVLASLTALINRPEPRLLKSEVRAALEFFLRKDEKHSFVALKKEESLPPSNAIRQLDEILRKFKERTRRMT